MRAAIFKHKTTGELLTQIPIMQIRNYDKLDSKETDLYYAKQLVLKEIFENDPLGILDIPINKQKIKLSKHI